MAASPGEFGRAHNFMLQVVGDARFVHFDGSSDPAVEVDHLLSTRGQLDADQTHFLLEKVTSYPAAVPTETKPTVSANDSPTLSNRMQNCLQQPQSTEYRLWVAVSRNRRVQKSGKQTWVCGFCSGTCCSGSNRLVAVAVA